MLELSEFQEEIASIAVDWRSGSGEAGHWAVATVGPFSLEIGHKKNGSIGTVSVESKPGGVQLWRSRNAKWVALPEVLDGMREYLRGVAEKVGGAIDE